jgi:rRNA-processing protein FCF1
MYCIDTSALVDGWIRYYPPDVFPTLWTKLEEMVDAKKVVAPDEVLRELEKKEDALHDWAKKNIQLFLPLDSAIQVATQDVLAIFPRLVDSERDRSTADPFVIAVARVHACCVVTGEKNSGNPRRPKIPNVCDHFKVRYINMLQFMREQKWQFSIR